MYMLIYSVYLQVILHIFIDIIRNLLKYTSISFLLDFVILMSFILLCIYQPHSTLSFILHLHLSSPQYIVITFSLNSQLFKEI